MERTKIGIIFGGQSPEYGVSLHSVSSVLRNMPAHFEVDLYGITAEGHWYFYDETDIDAIEHDSWQEKSIYPVLLSVDPKDHGFVVFKESGYEVRKVDVVFPVMHGAHGEDGTIQAVCELAGIPCVGCGMLSSALSMDKEYTHIINERAGIPMAKWIAVLQHDGIDLTKLYQEVKETIGIPCIIKPANAGSSFGVSKAKDEKSFIAGINDAFNYDKKILVEQFIVGFEVGCAVLGNQELVMGEPDEIEISTDIFDYTEKYNLITSQIHVPARINADTKQQIYDYAAKIYAAMSCSGLARIDFFVSDGKVVFNELNTIPGFTAHSRYPTMLKAIGYEFTKTIEEVVNLALNK